MKVSILKKTCIDALERHSEGGITADYQELLRRVEVSQARADALSQEMISLREHRDEVVRQIKHQHSHVLFLTEKIERMQAKGLGALVPRKFRRRQQERTDLPNDHASKSSSANGTQSAARNRYLANPSTPRNPAIS